MYSAYMGIYRKTQRKKPLQLAGFPTLELSNSGSKGLSQLIAPLAAFVANII